MIPTLKKMIRKLHEICHGGFMRVCVCVFNVIVWLWFVSLQSKSLFLCFLWSRLSLSVTEQYVLLSLMSLTALLSLCHSFPSHSIYPLILSLSCTLLTPFQLFAPFLFSLQPSIDIQTCGFILEPPLLSFPPLVCLSAQLHHSELSLQQCTIIICIYKNSKVSCQFVK